EDHARGIRRKERPAVVASRGVGQLAGVLAVGVHDVQFQVAVAVGAEDDLLAVGGVGALGVVALGVGQVLQVPALQVALVDLHVRVEVPRVAAADALLPVLLALLVLRLLVLLRVGVGMAAGEDDPGTRWVEVGAGGSAGAGADAPRVGLL